MPEQLPEHCPECGLNCGWFIPGEYGLFVRPDGEVRMGRDNNRRYGQKFEAQCNNPDCDAEVNLYLEADVVRTGEITPAGTKQYYDKLKENGPIPIERFCMRCENTFMTDAFVSTDTDTGGYALYAKQFCGCGTGKQERYEDAFVVEKVGTVTDEGVELEVTKKS